MPVYANQTLTFNISTSGSAFVTSTPWIPLDIHSTPFNTSFGIRNTGNGEVSFKVEHTFDDVFDPDVTPNAFTHADVSLASTDIDGNYAFPVRAIRLTTVSASASVALDFTVIQAGI